MRRTSVGALTAALICLGLAATASAAGPISLSLPQSDAFSILGRSCGGIQEQVYATGFAPNGFPTGEVYMQTRCGGSGRGGGYHYTTYTAWATVTWDWFGDTRSFAALGGSGGGSTTFSAEDSHGDRIYNVGTSALLETGEPPLAAPAAPSGVTATVISTEVVEEQPPVLSFQVGWTPAGETAGLITSSTVTATPVGSSAPVLSATVTGPGGSANLGPLQPRTTYLITVTSTDAEGTSEPSSPLEELSSGAEPPPAETCEQNSGTIKLTPGLSATPQIQSVTVKGKLAGCDGPADFSEGTYVAHLLTSEAVSCAALASPLGEATTPVSLVVKWLPLGVGKSTGTFSMPLTEDTGVSIGGTLEGGPLQAPLNIAGATVFETYKGAANCGVPAPGKTSATPVKSGTFTGTAIELG